MSIYKKNNPLSMIFVLLLVVALGAGLFLVQQKQETRRGAYFAGTKLLFVPGSISTKVGENVTVQLFTETDFLTGSTTEKAKVSSADLKFCYGEGFFLDAIDPATKITLNTEATFKTLAMVKDAGNCLRMTVLGDMMAKPENMKSGMVKIASVSLKARKVGKGSLTWDSTSQVTGYNANSTDVSLKIGEMKATSYEITEGGVVDEPTNTPTPTSSAGKPTNTPTPTPKEVGNWPTLNMILSFAGVRVSDSNCAKDWQVKVTVRAENGVMKTYEAPVVWQNDANDKGLVKFTVAGLKLVNFPYKEKVAVFVKGPKHLQVKYGENGQTAFYDQAGGKIDLSNKEAWYDFSGYPVLAGDVVSSSSEQDGLVDGRDFAYVKAESYKRTEGDHQKADLNGNCKMESQDLATLMLSLSEKQEQLY